jgi:hypothetical protein
VQLVEEEFVAAFLKECWFLTYVMPKLSKNIKYGPKKEIQKNKENN